MLTVDMCHDLQQSFVNDTMLSECNMVSLAYCTTHSGGLLAGMYTGYFGHTVYVRQIVIMISIRSQATPG